MTLPLIIIGAGGHAKVLVAALPLNSLRGLTDADPEKCGRLILGAPVLGDDSVILTFGVTEVALINGLGSTGNAKFRVQIFDRFRALGYKFADVIHPSAWISPDVDLAEGIQVMAGAVIQPGCRVGENTIINTGALIDHDCQIDRHCHIASGVTLSGGVSVGAYSHIGAGATVIEGIHIGAHCLVAAGAVVVTDVASGTRVAGVPAKEMRSV